MKSFYTYINSLLNDLLNWYLMVHESLHNLPPVSTTYFVSCFLTEITLVLGILSLLYNGIRAKPYWHLEEFNRAIWNQLLVILTTTVVMLSLSELNYYWLGMHNNTQFYCVSRFNTDPLLLFAKYVLLILTIFCVIIHREYFAKISQNWEYTVIIPVLTIAMLLTIAANDFFVAFISLEVQSLGLFIFLSFRKNSSMAIEAAIKYFMFTAFSSGVFVFGVSLLFCEFGTTHFRLLEDFMGFIIYEKWIIAINVLAITLILAALAIKLTLVPFQWWVGDVYHGSFNFVNSYVSIVTKIPVLTLLFKIGYGPFYQLSQDWIFYIQLIGLFSILYGTFYAFTEYNFKRFWAYSSVSHMGYIFIIMFCNQFYTGPINAIIYFLVYLLSNVFVWAFVIHLQRINLETLMFKDFLTILFDFISIRRTNKKLPFIFSLMLLSLAGMPIGLGFVPKALILYQLYASHLYYFFITIIIINIIAFTYYLRMIRFAIFNVNKRRIFIMPTYPRLVAWTLVFIFLLNSVFYILFAYEIFYIIMSLFFFY